MNQPPENNPQHLTLRPAQEEDAPLLVSILHTAFEEYRGRLDPPAGVHHETADTLLEKMREGFFIIASVDNIPAGCVFYQPEDDHVYLGRLAVLPPYRKQGVARALIEYVEQQALSLNLPCVQLGARTAIPYLQSYYTHLGYHVLRYASHEGYTEPTFIIMEKTLTQSPPVE